jgi:hypothetical protein
VVDGLLTDVVEEVFDGVDLVVVVVAADLIAVVAADLVAVVATDLVAVVAAAALVWKEPAVVL